MNVMLVSQCSKQALKNTRRILDQFAERKGDRTWQTAITLQGLTTLRKMLKKTARRNTAVACHWIKGSNQTELLWIVGNIGKFNEQGTVPTNITHRDILRTQDEDQWNTAEDIALLAGIAGLFHDFGKANKLFQKKLKSKNKLICEPYRHEWVSLRLFQAFVGNQSDQQWLERLANVSSSDEKEVLGRLIKDTPNNFQNPFKILPPLAKSIAWLIVSHHRLPKYNANRANIADNGPKIRHIDKWMIGKKFGPFWNSPQCININAFKRSDWDEVWQFEHGTPIRSTTWCKKAHSLAKRALRRPNLSKEWLDDRFSSHVARLSLMLADHCYSAGEAVSVWQDQKYNSYANTDRRSKKLKQKLDEHNVGVGHYALLLAKNLPKFHQTLPSLRSHRAFKQRTKNPKFRWQDKAYDLVRSISERTKDQGFFGVNMASTGSGKTYANAKVMYGLANEKFGCRFSVALGLRTLTLQTGDAFKKRLHLDGDDLAVLIGSQSVQTLHDIRLENQNIEIDSAEHSGSESAEDLFAEHQYVRYEGSVDDGWIGRWLNKSQKQKYLSKLISAPVLVSTIDHLMPATEAERGGKQIAPMLRLLTSDLVLDEPDDFDLADLPALTRLVNWAGMLGARVLLSSATLPPALIQSLFEAYLTGRRNFNSVCRDSSVPDKVCCAWFDEFGIEQSDHNQVDSFLTSHKKFVTKRIEKLKDKETLRLAKLVPVKIENSADILMNIADTLSDCVYELHANHHQLHKPSGKKVSIGLIRMANINPMVAVAKKLLSKAPKSDHHIHFCVYHSQYPLIIRSKIEEELDTALIRHDPKALWHVPYIKNVLEKHSETNHVFIVFATPVAEVGRDHDYDWAIAEPSSMRSLIQLAGRIQRHRQISPKSENFIILTKNYRGLKGDQVAYWRPGFESKQLILKSKDLTNLLQETQYRYINAIPRIHERNTLDHTSNFVDLEHVHLKVILFGFDQYKTIPAALWWRHNPSWCAEMQRQTPFRKSIEEEVFVLKPSDTEDSPEFGEVAESGEIKVVDSSKFSWVDLELAHRIHPWMDFDYFEMLELLAEELDCKPKEASIKFGEVRLRKSDSNWLFHPLLGVHHESS